MTASGVSLELIVRRRWAATVIMAVMLVARPAVAQSLRDGRLELSAGGVWVSALTFPDVNATQTAPGGVRRIVFRTRSELEASPGLVARVGVRVMSRVTAESTLSMNSTRLATRISDDVELAPDTTATEPVRQFLMEGGLLVRVVRSPRRTFTPFVAVGGGYLRQLNQGQTLVSTGRSYYAGGGAHYVLGGRGGRRVRSAGVRIDARAAFLERGVALDSAWHVVPVVGVAFFVRY